MSLLFTFLSSVMLEVIAELYVLVLEAQFLDFE